jgi:ferredoxin
MYAMGFSAHPPAWDAPSKLVGPMPDVSTKNRIAIEVDRALCYGFGDCVDTLPEVFALDDEDTAIVLNPDAAPIDDITEAAQNCPVDAIIILAEDGEQIYP